MFTRRPWQVSGFAVGELRRGGVLRNEYVCLYEGDWYPTMGQ